MTMVRVTCRVVTVASYGIGTSVSFYHVLVPFPNQELKFIPKADATDYLCEHVMRTEPVSPAPVVSASAAKPATADKPATSTATAGGFSSSRTLDLTIKTREGDTVTISSSQTTTVASAGSVGSEGSVGAAVKSTSSSLSISVDGSLSKDELADLQKVLKALGQAGQRKQARGVHRGHHGHHRHHGRDGGKGLSTIESISGSVTSSFAVISGTLVSTSAPDGASTSAADPVTPQEPAEQPAAA
jgi:hypothetical protein